MCYWNLNHCARYIQSPVLVSWRVTRFSEMLARLKSAAMASFRVMNEMPSETIALTVVFMAPTIWAISLPTKDLLPPLLHRNEGFRLSFSLPCMLAELYSLWNPSWTNSRRQWRAASELTGHVLRLSYTTPLVSPETSRNPRGMQGSWFLPSLSSLIPPCRADLIFKDSVRGNYSGRGGHSTMDPLIRTHAKNALSARLFRKSNSRGEMRRKYTHDEVFVRYQGDRIESNAGHRRRPRRGPSDRHEW